MNKDDICYYCGEKATTREHIPPQSFFPKSQKFNLVTIPSCDDHNSKKTNKDEYVRNYITIHRSVREKGYEKFEEKTRSAFKKNRKLQNALENAEKVQLDGVETGIFNAKKEIFDDFFDHLASGIFYQITKSIFNGKWTIHLISFHEDRELYESNTENLTYLLQAYEIISTKTNFKRIKEFENEKVFLPLYYLENNGNKTSIFLNLTFYEGFKVFILGEHQN